MPRQQRGIKGDQMGGTRNGTDSLPDFWFGEGGGEPLLQKNRISIDVKTAYIAVFDLLPPSVNKFSNQLTASRKLEI